MMKKIKPERDTVKPWIKDIGEIINRNKRNSEGTGFHVGWSGNGILEIGNLEIYSINVLGENR